MSSICPEEPTPSTVEDCGKCGLIEHGSRMIWGEGNPTAPIMVILDNPGARDNRNGDPFVCGTRQTLQKATTTVGLSVNNLYVTYILKRKPTRAYDKEMTRETCMMHLNQQLQNKKPTFILCLGIVSVQSFFQDEEMDVKSLRGKMYDVRGIKTTVAYHPLAVRRRPNLWSLFIEDWQYVD
ncbi:uracil-DNA glycosylase [Virgibacillus sp. FSP13]